MRSMKKNLILNFLKVFTSILFPMVTFKYATNVLSSENVGLVNYGSSVIAYFSLIAGLGVSSYAIREGSRIRNEKKQVTQFASEVFSINIISCIISYCLLFVSIHLFSFLKPYKELLLIQSLVILFVTLGTEWINIIYEDYLYITIRTIFCQILSFVCLVLFVKKQDDYLIYAVIMVFSQIGMFLLNIVYVRRYIKCRIILKKVLLKHLKPILIIFSTTIAVTIYGSIDTTMLGVMASKESVAMYTAATKIYTAVKTIFSTLIVVLVPRLSYVFIEKKIYIKYLKKILDIIVVLFIPCTIIMYLYAENFILLISGAEYLIASKALRIMAIAVLFSVLSCYITNCVFLINRLEKYSLVATILGALLNLLLNLYFIPKYNFTGAAITTLLSEILVFIVCIIFLINKSVLKLKPPIKTNKILKLFVATFIMIIFFIVERKIFNNYILELVICVPICIFTYFGCLYIFKYDLIYDELKSIITLILNRINKEKYK